MTDAIDVSVWGHTACELWYYCREATAADKFNYAPISERTVVSRLREQFLDSLVVGVDESQSWGTLKSPPAGAAGAYAADHG